MSSNVHVTHTHTLPFTTITVLPPHRVFFLSRGITIFVQALSMVSINFLGREQAQMTESCKSRCPCSQIPDTDQPLLKPTLWHTAANADLLGILVKWLNLVSKHLKTIIQNIQIRKSELLGGVYQAKLEMRLDANQAQSLCNCIQHLRSLLLELQAADLQRSETKHWGWSPHPTLCSRLFLTSSHP